MARLGHSFPRVESYFGLSIVHTSQETRTSVESHAFVLHSMEKTYSLVARTSRSIFGT